MLPPPCSKLFPSTVSAQLIADKFYEFTMVLTIVSLIVSVLVLAVGRLKRRLPPPHSLLLAAGTLNSRLCCSPSPFGQLLFHGEERERSEMIADGCVRHFNDVTYLTLPILAADGSLCTGPPPRNC